MHPAQRVLLRNNCTVKLAEVTKQQENYIRLDLCVHLENGENINTRDTGRLGE